MVRAIKEKKPVRSYSGEMWRTNSSNKRRLAKDFNNKCAYCDDYDIYGGGYNSYHVEHFAPKEKFPYLQYTYENLLYSCPYCNISKSNKWISDKAEVSVIAEKGFIDPCTDDYYEHLKRKKDGSIIYTTKLGEYMYYELNLYLSRHRILYNLEQLRLKRELLKNKIDLMKGNGQDVLNLEDLYKNLCVVFCEYYDLFTKC